MNLLEQFSSVLLRYTSHEYARCTSVVELFTSNYDISPAALSDALSLNLIFWKFVTEQVVEVWSCPIRVDREDLCFDRLGGWFSCLLADGRLVELLNKDTGWNRGPLGTHIRQLGSLIVVVSEYVCQLQSVKGALQFPDLLAVSRHFCAGARVLFLNLVDDQFRITANCQPP